LGADFCEVEQDDFWMRTALAGCIILQNKKGIAYTHHSRVADEKTKQKHCIDYFPVKG
jgi:hypothetical protein